MKSRFKAAFRRFVIKENGAVSNYVIIVTLLLFLFNAVLIDFVRIMVAEYQVDQASKSAIRSSFSSFNKDVQNKGLFVVNEGAESPDQIFSEVFEKNLTVDEGSYYKFVDTRVEDASFEMNDQRTFSNTEIVKHQILEDMKYTAPIEFGKIIVDGILPYTCTMMEAEIYVDISKDINDLIKDRDEEMNQAVTHLRNAHQDLESVEGKLNNNSSSTYPNVNNLNDAKKHFPEYLEEEDGEFEQDLRRLLTDIRSAADDGHGDLEKARKALRDAQTINNSIEKKISDTRKEVEEKYTNLSNGDCSQEAMSEVENELDGLTEQINDYVIEDSFFTTALQRADDAMESVDWGSPGSSSSLRPYVQYQITHFDELLLGEDIAFTPVMNRIQSHYRTALDDTKDARNYADDNYEETDTGDTGDSGGLSDAFQALNTLKDIINKGNGLVTDTEKYSTLQGLVNDYGSSSEASTGDLDMDDPEEGASDAFDMIGSLFHNLGDIALEMRDHAYINEYILTRFKADDTLGVMEGSSYPDNFLFINREVEYILYGHHVTGANYLNALLELSATRFAFNFVSAFTQPAIKVIPHPLPKFLSATSWAFSETVKDIRNLTTGNEVQLLKIRGVKPFATDYKFYLRLFLFLHQDPNDERINRIQAVVDDKTGEDIIDAPTYATGKAEASIDLWFIPSVIDMLGATGVLEGKVRNGRYYIEEQIDYSY
ncbi:DUF5702 domain-containing protein [Oceanobacillus picturae]|uniref:DUF5702 domain-containing protein n=1 Tax=Oceanobacillus picturae TaxID=171693 RepID=UPI000E682F4C|nr:DUF5702 domain-containing protein [Oceanobacillus picturae]RIU93620.1 hypothetical protein D1864_06495 [Oceanobacillus picturae]